MEAYTEFAQHWDELYQGIVNRDWLDVVLPASAMLVDPMEEFLYVRHAALNDDDYIAKFDEHYGIDLLHVWMNFYHWEGASFGQPTYGELREFSQTWERMVHASIIENENRNAAVAISRMNHTPVTQEIDECLEMVGMDNKVRGFLAKCTDG